MEKREQDGEEVKFLLYCAWMSTWSMMSILELGCIRVKGGDC